MLKFLRENPPSVLFVCTANACRSPMAVALWNEKLGREGLFWRTGSAGTMASEGEPASIKAQQALMVRGINISSHRSRPFSLDLGLAFSLILTMELGQKEVIIAEFPELASRVYLLTEMVSLCHDISDPTGGTLADHLATIDEIESVLTGGYQKICLLASSAEKRINY